MTRHSLITVPPTGHGPGIATRLVIDVVSGDALPVAWIDVEAVFVYPDGSERIERGHSDAGGLLVLRTIHEDAPNWVAIRVAGRPQGFYRVTENMTIVVEL